MFKKYCQAVVVGLLSISPLLFAADVEKLADDDWLLVRSDNFEIVTDLDQEKGQSLAEDLEAYRFFFTYMMNIKVIPGLKPLKILAIGNTSNFSKLDLPDTWAGVFNQGAFGYAAIANVDNYRTSLKSQTFARQVLFHEYNHFMVRFTPVTLPVPMWYDEGMAEYWGSFKYDGEKIKIGDPSALQGRMNDLVNMGGSIILDSEKLMNTTELPFKSERVADKNLVGQFYAQSFFLVHYFNSSPELRQQLQNYVLYLNKGYKQDQAFQKAFDLTYAELDKNAKSYLKKNLLIRVLSAEGGLSFPKPRIAVSKLDKPGFYSEMSDILPLFGSFGRDQTKQLLERNIALNPNSANAKAKLLLRGMAADPKQLEAEVAQAEPQNPLLAAYRGDTLATGADRMRRAGLPGWEEQAKKARSFFRRAVKSDPSLALPYFGLGELYKFLPETEPLQEGLVGLESASLYDRSPNNFAEVADMAVRMNLGADALPAVRNAVAFSKEKDKSRYAFMLDNLEILQEASRTSGAATATGLRYASGGEYLGAVVNGKPQGQGKFTRPDGSYYEGGFDNGVMQGQGKLVHVGGHEYAGEFQQGIARGKGTLTYPGASMVYRGEVEYGIPHGKGVSESKAATMEGTYWYGYLNGHGKIVAKDSQKTTEGRWVYDLYEWPEADGTVFLGFQTAEGKRNGKGVCVVKASLKIEDCTYKDGVRVQKEEVAAQE